MTPREELLEEHAAILRILDILDHVCERLESGIDVASGDIQEIVEFLIVFADGCHHGKEEEILFPALERVGIPRERGPIGIMLAEHDLGRKYIRGMKEALEKGLHSQGDVLPSFIGNARAYGNLLSLHISKENTFLFPAVDQRLSPEIQRHLVTEFGNLERERLGPGRHREFMRALARLSKVYTPLPSQ
jgi:hemerythrin-like domain-containing protein